MIGPNATWGDYRKIYQMSLDAPDQKFEDNILADPQIRAFSEGRPDDEIVRDAQPDFADQEDSDSDSGSEDPESGLTESVIFNLVIDDQGEVLLLTRTDNDQGTLEYRQNGEWVPITADDDIPALDDYPFTRVDGQAVAIWDNLEDNYDESQFKPALLDDTDQ